MLQRPLGSEDWWYLLGHGLCFVAVTLLVLIYRSNLYLFILGFRDMVSYSPGWPLTHCVVEAGHEPSDVPACAFPNVGIACWFYEMLAIEPRLVRTRQALCRLSYFPSFSFWISKRG